MANQWLRLWHDMPTDPKWRTIAKASGQRIGDVMAVYVHLLVCASNATERGRTQSFNPEDVASALDLDTEQVEKIVVAMQARVLDGDMVAGWEKRQVAREDGAAERSKAWREAQKAAAERDANAGERKRTPDKDTDKDKEKNKKEGKRTSRAVSPVSRPDDVAEQVWADWVALRKRKRADVSVTTLEQARFESGKAGVSLERFLQIWCMRGSQGLQADWLRADERRPATGETPYQQSQRARVAEFAPGVVKRPEAIDVESSNVAFIAGR